ncbi:hypothetical protein [Pseudoxanthomonas composti]|uniref:Uncharacterized protein n=1 Tax=Pseudoxanthomonas composti TaxID=2137479 RepID=A0A4Q1JW23_9GAMM|nr:hypothetical protein [Pseudoxanthomonas composti]RXR06498.1 hypothetical protein EPA99_07580 [Pseudoxanthomonas composti]
MASHGAKGSWLLAGAVAAVLPGCGPAKLTEQECIAIQQREMAQIASWSDAARDPKWAAERSGANVAACVAGERYTRKDYECFVSASTNAEIGQCMNEESLDSS